MNFVQKNLTCSSIIFLSYIKEKTGTSETVESIIRTFISENLHFSASNLDPNHVLERSPPSTENLYNRFIHFYYCTTHCCEIPDHGGPELHP